MEPQLSPATDDLWTRVRAWLDRVKAGSDLRTSLAEFVPRVAGGFTQLTITAREFLGERMLAELHSGLSVAEPLRGLDHAILLLSDPYFSRTASQISARRILRAALDAEFLDSRSFQDLQAIANALIATGHKEPSPTFWLDFYSRFESETGAFDIAFAGLLDYALPAALDLVRSHPTQFVANRLVSYLPRLDREHHRNWLIQHLTALVADLGTSEATTLLEGAKALGIPLENSRLGKPTLGIVPLPVGTRRPDIPPELKFSLKHFELEEEAHRGRIRPQPLRVILSKYAEDSKLYQFQDDVLNLLKSIAKRSGETLESIDSQSFQELRIETRPYARDLFAFPMYLTKSKSNAGDGVLPYGTHHRLGLLVPGTSRAKHELHGRKHIGLRHLLRTAKANHLEIIYLDNYAIGEMVLEQLTLNFQHPAHWPQRKPMPPRASDDRNDKTAGLPELDHLKNDWLFLFDLGDAGRIAALRKTREFSGCTELIVKHKLDIPVGLGCTKYAAKWVVEHCHEIADGLNRHVSTPPMRTLFKRIGVELTTSLPPPQSESYQKTLVGRKSAI